MTPRPDPHPPRERDVEMTEVRSSSSSSSAGMKRRKTSCDPQGSDIKLEPTLKKKFNQTATAFQEDLVSKKEIKAKKDKKKKKDKKRPLEDDNGDRPNPRTRIKREEALMPSSSSSIPCAADAEEGAAATDSSVRPHPRKRRAVSSSSPQVPNGDETLPAASSTRSPLMTNLSLGLDKSASSSSDPSNTQSSTNKSNQDQKDRLKKKKKKKTSNHPEEKNPDEPRPAQGQDEKEEEQTDIGKTMAILTPTTLDPDDVLAQGRALSESSALPGSACGLWTAQRLQQEERTVTLLLFYQYVEPPWPERKYKQALGQVEQLARSAGVTGRMRVAKEGLNCTLTGPDRMSVLQFCRSLRQWQPEHFRDTEFKLTHHLPQKHAFRELKIIPVQELVHYGLDGDKAPPIDLYHGVHLEPAEYHEKLAQENTVVIDVRNHYEVAIGHFDPPTVPTDTEAPSPAVAPAAPKLLDPKMRKSTEFPVWLDDPQTKEQLRGKQVLMYCTGGIRCERATALLRYKMETDPSVQELNIQGVYQLQGGIDKYFKAFPDGGYWKGKNYTFDRRFAHAPVEKEAQAVSLPAGAGDKTTTDDFDQPSKANDAAKSTPMGQCEACKKPWDKYCGNRRCPTCGVPSLICRSCWQADQEGIRKLDRNVRCDLCVEEGVRSKRELRAKEQKALEEYESRLSASGLLLPKRLGAGSSADGDDNPQGVTRLYLKNMCRRKMTEEVLMEHLAGITHIVWKTDRKTGSFFGQAWVEMASPQAASAAVRRSGETVLGRPLYIEYQPSDIKDVWPPPNSAVRRS